MPSSTDSIISTSIEPCDELTMALVEVSGVHITKDNEVVLQTTKKKDATKLAKSIHEIICVCLVRCIRSVDKELLDERLSKSDKKSWNALRKDLADRLDNLVITHDKQKKTNHDRRKTTRNHKQQK